MPSTFSFMHLLTEISPPHNSTSPQAIEDSDSGNSRTSNIVPVYRKKLEEAEVKHRKNLLKVSEDCEAEIRQKDHHLAVVEARLCQLIIQSHNDKRFRPDGASNGLPGEVSYFQSLDCQVGF